MDEIEEFLLDSSHAVGAVVASDLVHGDLPTADRAPHVSDLVFVQDFDDLPLESVEPIGGTEASLLLLDLVFYDFAVEIVEQIFHE